MKGDKERWILNEGEEACARMKDRGSGGIDSWLVRGDLVIHGQNKKIRVLIDGKTVCDCRVSRGLPDKVGCKCENAIAVD